MKYRENYSLKCFIKVLAIFMIMLIFLSRNPLNVSADTKIAGSNVFYKSPELPVIQLNDQEKDDVSSENNSKKNVLMWVCVVSGAVAVTTILVTVSILSAGRHKKSQEMKKRAVKGDRKITGNGQQISHFEKDKNNGKISGDAISDSTGQWGENLKRRKKETDVPNTMILWQIIIRLTNVNDSQEVYEKSIDSTAEFVGIRIGRGKSQKVDMKINDGAVSDIHCEIIKKGNLYYIKDINSTNGTRYNGRRVSGEVAITDIGLLKIGQKTYNLEIIDRSR